MVTPENFSVAATTHPIVDVSQVSSPHSPANLAGRVLWGVVWRLFYRPSPKPFHGWRRFLLKLFGARIGHGARPYPTAKIWAPWNLEMGEHSCIGDDVDCYCVGPIKIGAHAIVSQYSYLCAATHDYEHPHFPLLKFPIVIGAQAWVCADVFVGPGVTIGEGAVVGARSSVFKNVEPWAIVAGSPAQFVKKRVLKNFETSGRLKAE